MTEKTSQVKLFSAVLLSLFCSAAAAEPIRVFAVAQEDIYAGEPFVYQIIIDGVKEPGQADISSLSEFSPEYTGGSDISQSRVTIINDRQSRQETKRYVMSYHLTAANAGRFKLPAVSVELKGDSYTANPLDIVVQDLGRTDEITLDVVFSETEVYLGQPISVIVRLFNSDRVGDFNLSLPVFAATEVFLLEDSVAPPGSGGRIGRLNLVDGGEVLARAGSITHNGRSGQMIFFEKVLIPLRTGRFEFAAPRVSCKVATGRTSRSVNPFGMFGGRREYARAVHIGKEVTVTVKPLPSSGRPSDFSGLVGRYSITGSAEPTSVSVGDPIELTVSVCGEFLKAVRPPDLAALGAFAEHFKIPAESAALQPPAEDDSGNCKIFVQTIRAADESVAEIPAVPLSYFDVDSGKYVTVYSDPIALAVRPSRVVGADQAVGRGSLEYLSGELESALPGMAANYIGPELLKDSEFSPLSAVWRPPYVLLWSLPALFCVVSLLLRLAISSDPARRMARLRAAAAGRAVRSVRRLGDAIEGDRLAFVLRQYISDRYGRQAASLTGDDCREILSADDRDEALIDEFCSLLDRSEDSRYAAGAVSAADSIDPDRVCILLKALDEGEDQKVSN